MWLGSAIALPRHSMLPITQLFHARLAYKNVFSHANDFVALLATIIKYQGELVDELAFSQVVV